MTVFWTDDSARWAAVCARDVLADGAFVYGVHSTRIYCRPTCPSRRPKPAGVIYFRDAREAEAAGFRACKRCRPRATAPLSAEMRAACDALATETPPDLPTLAARAGLSPTHFQRAFTRAVGVSPREYADAHRVRRLRTALREGPSVTDAIYAAGYASSSRMYERASEHLGMTPGTYRRGGAGMSVAYTTQDSPLGRLLVAATEQGVCGVSLGDNDAELLAWLREQYPAATLFPGSDALQATVATVLAYLEGREPRLDLPLDVRGTAFQRQVWQALREIPYGETRSYSQVAAGIGRATAVRAVARACALNRAALIIPCHRVIGSDGSLTGYRWGLDRKRRLLAREHAAATSSASDARLGDG